MFSEVAASFHGALESQSGICALEGVVANHDVLHAAREFAADNETAMSMIYGIVLDVDILARTGFYSSCSCATLHADTVIAGIHDVVDDEYILAA